MVLPPVETTPLLVITFTKRASDQLISLVIDRLEEGGLIVTRKLTKSSVPGIGKNKLYLQVTTTQRVLEKYAERIHLMKVTNDTNTVEYFTCKQRTRFCHSKQTHVNGLIVSPILQEWQRWWRNSNSSTNNASFDEDNDESTEQRPPQPQLPRRRLNSRKSSMIFHPNPESMETNRDQYGLFTSNEWILLVYHILDDITVLPQASLSDMSLRGFHISTPLSRLLDTEYHADYQTHNTVYSRKSNNRKNNQNKVSSNSHSSNINNNIQESGSSDDEQFGNHYDQRTKPSLLRGSFMRNRKAINYNKAVEFQESSQQEEKKIKSSLNRAMRSSTVLLQEHNASSSVCLWHVLLRYDLIETVTPVSIPKLRHQILRTVFDAENDDNADDTKNTDRNRQSMDEHNQSTNTIKHYWEKCINFLNPISDAAITEIQEYYGWEVAYYFAWMGFVTRWTMFPGLLGILIVFLRWYRNDSIETDEYTPFYGLITFLWSVLLMKFWIRHENRLAYQWGTFSLTQYEKRKYFTTRPQFHGYVRISPVTGLIETYYPTAYRRMKYVISAIVTSAMLLIAFIVMCLSLNLQGYIHPKSDRKRWNDNNPHPFYVQSFAVLSEEGHLFDAKSLWRCYIPVVLHVTCILILNSIYRYVAVVLTRWENHESELDHRNSVILKRFLFEAFDCYIALLYLAFYERDVERLQMELIAVFQIDTLRRVLLECILPMIQKGVLKFFITKDEDAVSSLLQSPLSSSKDTMSMMPTDESILDDLQREKYEHFDDFMEIVIQFGYVTLFASAYPLASMISIISNWIEIRSDCTKLAKVCRRPRPFRTSGLQVWTGLLSTVLGASVLTNCLIAGFTSGQLQYFLPHFYKIQYNDEYKSGDPQHIQTSIVEENGWLVVFLIFGLERLLIIVGILLFIIIPSVPEDLTDELERRQYAQFLEQLEDSTGSTSTGVNSEDGMGLLDIDTNGRYQSAASSFKKKTT